MDHLADRGIVGDRGTLRELDTHLLEILFEIRQAADLRPGLHGGHFASADIGSSRRSRTGLLDALDEGWLHGVHAHFDFRRIEILGNDHHNVAVHAPLESGDRRDDLQRRQQVDVSGREGDLISLSAARGTTSRGRFKEIFATSGLRRRRRSGSGSATGRVEVEDDIDAPIVRL